MDVGKLFRDLSLGELSNLSCSNEGSGTIVESFRPRLVLYTNDGLETLYSRFVLREADILLETHNGILNYRLESKHALSSDEECFEKYIIDSCAEPFRDDIIKVLAVYDSCGLDVPLNDDGDPRSVFTPSLNVLQVPYQISGQALGIHYQAKHLEIPEGDLTYEIELPVVLERALKSYIAYKVYSHMNGQEPTAKAQEHYAMYDAICMEVIDNDLVSNSVSTTNSKFSKRGWV